MDIITSITDMNLPFILKNFICKSKISNVINMAKYYFDVLEIINH